VRSSWHSGPALLLAHDECGDSELLNSAFVERARELAPSLPRRRRSRVRRGLARILLDQRGCSRCERSTCGTPLDRSTWVCQVGSTSQLHQRCAAHPPSMCCVAAAASQHRNQRRPFPSTNHCDAEVIHRTTRCNNARAVCNSVSRRQFEKSSDLHIEGDQ
jgi:hypothetical protein